MFRLYIDEDSMTRALVTALRARGVDVESALDAGMIEREDEEHLKYATTQGRVLYSFNIRDFNRLHSDWLGKSRSHAGIVLARQGQFSVGEQMRRLLRLMAAHSSEQMKGRLEFLSAWP